MADLNAGTAIEYLREHVTTVRPGEMLVVQVPDTWSPGQAHELSQQLNEIVHERGYRFDVLVVPGCGLAVATGKSARTVAEWQGFQRGHPHRLGLLPVVDFRYDFYCECGGRLSVRCTEETASFSADEIERAAYRELGRLESTLLPEEFTDGG